MRTLFLLVLALFGGITGCAGRPLPPHAGSYRNAAVAADHEAASRAGLEVLKKGGNAVDAAVAVSFTLSVVRPESCGIGGGGFMIIRFSEAGRADQRRLGRSVPRQVALNYREMAPWAVGPEFYEKEDRFASTHGGKAVGIPGTVAGLLTAHEKFGRLDRAAVLAPAIRVAEAGFVADENFVHAAKEAAADFEKNPAWKERFRFVWERMLREGKIKIGDVITNPEQASALRLISEKGMAAFYQGPIAQAMIETVRRDGGVMTHDDLSRFRVASVEPLTFQAFGRTFLTMPPPSSGGVAMAEAMGILGLILEQPLRETQEKIEKNNPPRGFLESIAASGGMSLPYGPMSPWYCHRLTEALKHAFADRAEWLGDPDFVDVPVARLVSREYTGMLARRFQPERTLPLDQYGTRQGRTPTSLSEDHGTSHLSVVDAAGNAVACTETINLGFGSCLAVDAFGFILNNQMDDFTTRRGQANAFGLKQSDRNLPAPGKRPLSSMTPTIVLGERGEVEVVAGASGGPRIITGTMQAILQRVGFGREAWNAVQAPRLHHQWSPNVVRLERGFDATDGATGVSLVGELQRFGHRVEPIGGVGVVQMIARERGEWQAASDPRKGGKPAGY